jgi:hypothetical protein
MATTQRHISPGGKLLRNSRLFSLPPPLPRPIIEARYKDFVRTSDTATTPYPLRQAIASPDASRFRGDWGLKRPLPLRSTNRKPNNALRVSAIDTYESVTDYESALDHTKNLERLQELNLAISRQRKSVGGTPSSRALLAQQSPSAFEPALDHTAKPGDPDVNAVHQGRGPDPSRWKHRGPSVADISDKEFKKYLGDLKGRSTDFFESMKWVMFQAFVTSSLAQIRATGDIIQVAYYGWLGQLSTEDMKAYVSEAYPKGLDGFDATFKSIFNTISEEGVAGGARADAATAPSLPSSGFKSHLEKLGRDALPMGLQRALEEAAEVERNLLHQGEPGSYLLEEYFRLFLRKVMLAKSYRYVVEDFLDLPPSEKTMPLYHTHPSAGISYHRTSRVLDNHPLFGALQAPQPVEGRVLPSSHITAGRSRISDARNQSMHGIAGVAALNVGSLTDNSFRLQDTPESVWAQPLKAHISSEGKLMLDVRTASQPAIAIAQDKIVSMIKEMDEPVVEASSEGGDVFDRSQPAMVKRAIPFDAAVEEADKTYSMGPLGTASSESELLVQMRKAARIGLPRADEGTET